MMLIALEGDVVVQKVINDGANDKAYRGGRCRCHIGQFDEQNETNIMAGGANGTDAAEQDELT